MKKLYYFIIAALLIAVPLSSFAKEQVNVDVLYMDHGPMQHTLRQLRVLFPKYKDKLIMSWYDVESKEGIAFKSKMKIKGHVPMVIWVDGKFEQIVNNSKIKFTGFPTGAGPSFAQGKWTFDDLAAVLDRKTK